MRKLPLLARVYVVAIIGVAAVILAAFATLPTRDEIHVFVGLTAATILAAACKLRMPSRRC